MPPKNARFQAPARTPSTRATSQTAARQRAAQANAAREAREEKARRLANTEVIDATQHPANSFITLHVSPDRLQALGYPVAQKKFDSTWLTRGSESQAAQPDSATPTDSYTYTPDADGALASELTYDTVETVHHATELSSTGCLETITSDGSSLPSHPSALPVLKANNYLRDLNNYPTTTSASVRHHDFAADQKSYSAIRTANLLRAVDNDTEQALHSSTGSASLQTQGQPTDLTPIVPRSDIENEAFKTGLFGRDLLPEITKPAPELPNSTAKPPRLVVKLALPPGYSLDEDMAPVRDPNNVDVSIKEVVQNLYDVQTQIHGFEPVTQPLLVDNMTKLAHSLSHLQTITSPTQSPNNPVHQVRIAPEIIDYVDDGRNPDIFTRDFAELVVRGNAVINGKQQAFRDFSKIFAEALKEGIEGISEDVDRIMKNAGLADEEEPKEEPKKEPKKDVQENGTNKS